MDLHNNSVGFSIIENNPGISENLYTDNTFVRLVARNELIDKICESLQNGDMQIFTDSIGEDPDLDDTNLIINSESCSCVE